MPKEFPITRTKVLVPRRKADLLTRQRLLDTLDDLLDGKLAIIAAPAGSGKTSLLVDFAHHTGLPVCWYSIDPLDRDPQRFIAHFIAAIQQRFPDFGRESEQLLNSSSQDNLNIDILATTLINDTYEHIREHFVIMLDDYHLVGESKPVDQFVNRFVQDVDENCHLVIASRTLLALPDLPLMVARSQVGGLSFDELGFRAIEIQELLETNFHKSISDSLADELYRQTEGWVTGLLLSSQMPGGEIDERLRVARVSGVGLYDYLAQQVLDQQTPKIQSFLLRTSLLEEFDASFCREVIGGALGIEDDNWDELLDVVLRRNLFVLPVEGESLWLRYHHLFRDFLQNRIQRDRPQEARRIQSSLAGVYTRRGEWERAFAIYQRLGSQEETVSLVETAGTSLLARGRLVTLADWLGSLPPEVMAQRPVLLSLQASVLMMRGDTAQGLTVFNKAIMDLRAADPAGNPAFRAQLAVALTKRSAANRLLGNYTESLEDAEEALSLTGKEEALRSCTAEAMRARGITLYHQGSPRDGLIWLTQALTGYQLINDGENIARVSLEIGMVNNVLGDYPASETAYLRALGYWQETGNSVWQANLLNNLGVLQQARGDYETAASTLDRAVQHARLAGYPRLEAFALVSIGDLYRDLDAYNEAQGAYHQARQIAERIKDRFLQVYLNLAESRLARLQGRMRHAMELNRIALELASEDGSHYELCLCEAEHGGIQLFNQQYQAAMQTLHSPADYFFSSGHRMEAIQAIFYLVVASLEIGDILQAGEQYGRLSSTVNDPQVRHPLVTAARELNNHLKKLILLDDYTSQVKDLIQRVDEFEKRIPHFRKHLRQKAALVPLGPPHMVIRALGRMQVKVNGHLISTADWQTQSARDLFFLLLNQPEGFTKDAIGAIFWPEASPAELKLRFKNNVYRLRHAIGKDVVTFQDDYYQFNHSLDYEYDVEIFRREVTAARQVDELDHKIAHYLAAMKQYRGCYLPEMDQSWLVAEREQLQGVFLDVLLSLVRLYLEKSELDNAMRICERAIKEDVCLEDAYRLGMQTHAAKGNRASIVRMFEQCREALRTEVDAAPSTQTQELFERLMR